MADFHPSIEKNGHPFAVPRLQFRVGIHVDDIEIERQTALDAFQGGLHVFAKMTVAARNKCQFAQNWSPGSYSPSGRKVTKRLPSSLRISNATGRFRSSLATMSLNCFALVISVLFTRMMMSPA